MNDAAAKVSTYTYSRAPGLRIVGLALVPFAVVWVVAGFTDFPAWAVALLVVDAVVLVGLSLRLIVFPPRLLTLSETGYRIHGVRGNPRPSADWTDVESATTTDAGGSPTVLITLNGGASSVLPLGVLGDKAMAAQREIHERLNTAHGYRLLGEEWPKWQGNTPD